MKSVLDLKNSIKQRNCHKLDYIRSHHRMVILNEKQHLPIHHSVQQQIIFQMICTKPKRYIQTMCGIHIMEKKCLKVEIYIQKNQRERILQSKSFVLLKTKNK